MRLITGIVLPVLTCVGLVLAAPIPPRSAVSALSTAQVSSYKPYTYYAGAAYCKPETTLKWTCSACKNNPTFKPIASGGDGAATQYWYVGYDDTLKSIIVAYQGTNPKKIQSILTDVKFLKEKLDSALFPGISSSIETHGGFAGAQKKSAAAVLAAVKKGMAQYKANKVTLVGHSLGGALAILSTGYLSLNLPSGTSLKTVTYGSPRVGNDAFVDFINPRSDMSRINNKKDPVPILPGRFMGFSHTKGEIHITSSGSWVSCPGKDNTDPQCTVGTVSDVLKGVVADHSGPYDGVSMTCGK